LPGVCGLVATKLRFQLRADGRCLAYAIPLGRSRGIGNYAPNMGFSNRPAGSVGGSNAQIYIRGSGSSLS